MADAGFFKGTSADQDRRFSDKEVKLLKSMKFPAEFDKKVDMRKVNLQVIRPWITKKVVELVGFEDEVVVEYAMGLLEDKQQPTPDPKKMQINLTGFLTNSTPGFMLALWALLLEAQDSPAGVPRTFVEEKKEEMRKAREGDTRVLDERDRRARLDDHRTNDRGGFRGGGRGRGRGRGRGGFDDDRGGRTRDGGWGTRGGAPGRSYHRSSRSPPPRRPSPSYDVRNSRSPPPRRYRSPPHRSRSPAFGPRPSRSPPSTRRRPRSPSRSRSPAPPIRRRLRSPSFTPPPRDRRYRGGRDSRSPPPRRRRISPSPTRSFSRSRSRSRSPHSRNMRRRRSVSPPPKRRAGRRSPSRSISQSRSESRSPGSPPPKRRNVSRERRRRYSRSPSSSGSRRNDDRMDVDDGAKGGLKIKGQAEAQKRKSKWEDDGAQHGASHDSPTIERSNLEKRENELKEKALRNKVVRTRKGSGGTSQIP